MANEFKKAKSKKKFRIGKISFYIFLIIYSSLCIYPVYFSLISSVKSNEEIFSKPFSLPLKYEFINYVTAWNVGHIGQYFINTVFLTASTLILVALIGSLAAYALARFAFKTNGFVYIYFIAGLMIPMQSVIIPLAFIFGKFHLNDNYMVMILLFSAFCLPMTVFILVGFMKSIPIAIEEAAIIDGCTILQVFRIMIVPLAMPAIASVSIFNFIQTWNNLLLPLMFIKKESLNTISVGLLSFFAQRNSNYGPIMAAIVITILPSILVYILLQEKVEKGLTAGSVKG